ncbi:MAG: molybdenum cofactor guanylyltransferase [Chloroflexota bacterium]
MIEEQLTLAVLAGGRGSRMGGVDKASLIVGGRTLLDRQLAAAGPILHEALVIANDDRLAGDGRFRVVLDPDPHAGVLPALLAALEAATSPYLLLLACDMPFVHRDVVSLLVEMIQDFDAVVPFVDGHLQPMLAVYRVEACKSAIRAALARGDRRMISFLDDVNSTTVPMDKLSVVAPVEHCFFNINTPDDLAEAQRIYADVRLKYTAGS